MTALERGWVLTRSSSSNKSNGGSCNALRGFCMLIENPLCITEALKMLTDYRYTRHSRQTRTKRSCRASPFSEWVLPPTQIFVLRELSRMKITWIQLNLKANKMTCQAFIFFFKSDAILRTWDRRCEEGIVSQCFEYESLRIHTKLFYRDWSRDRAVLREVYCVKTGFRSVCLALYLFINYV